MNKHKLITITALATALVFIMGISIEDYLNKKDSIENQDYYDNGYVDGILYTQRSGNIAFTNSEGNLTETSIVEICNQLNLKEVK